MERHVVVRFAVELANAECVPLVVLIESWNAGGWGSYKTLLGMGSAVGRWQEQLEIAGHPKRRTLRANVDTWRSDTRIRTKAAAVSYVGARWKMKAETDDAAEAACITAWGEHSGAVAAVLPALR